MKNSALNNTELKIPLLPTLCTLANLVCGWVAIVLANSGDAATDQGQQTLAAAGVCILVAMVFDGLDGMLARLLHQATPFGKVLDSLCDSVSFGVAPALLLAKLTPESWQAIPLASPLATQSLGGFWLVCVVVRLARFNSGPDEQATAKQLGDEHVAKEFIGLPCPAAAALIASVVFGLTAMGDQAMQLKSLLPVLGCAAAMLMVSSVKYPRIPARMKGSTGIATLVGLCCLAALSVPFYAVVLPLACVAYAGGPPLTAVLRAARSRADSMAKRP